MKKIKQESPNGRNILNELHLFLMDLPIRFREAVCIECDWSLPTFYRKMKAADKVGNPALSNAEKEGILRKAKTVAQEISTFIEKYI